MKDDTLAIHGGFSGDRETGATAVPIHQTASYAYKTAQELADVFDGKAPGYIYTRIANPTTTALEARLTQLEDGIGCIATSSGMAAIASAVMALTRAGDTIIASNGIFGGTVSLFENTLSRFGVETIFVDADDSGNYADAMNDNVKLIFVETIGNPRMDVVDVPAVAKIANKAGIPLIVDNTTTPVIFKPGDFGADIVVHSTTKFINGHGTAIGGAIIDVGNFDWRKGPFEDIKKVSEKTGQLAFLAQLRNLTFRDLGGCPGPMNSFLMLQGLETLPMRMEKHSENALKLAEFLKEQKQVTWVNYPGLKDSKYYDRVTKLFNGCGAGLLTFGLGERSGAFGFIDSLKLAKNMANLGDAKTLVIHPESTIFHEFDAAKKEKMGVTADMIRVSVGIEDFEDIKADFEQAFEKSS